MASQFYDGGTDGRSWITGGHSTALVYGARGMFYRHAFSGRFGHLPTFNPTDGQRALGGPSRNARYWHWLQCVLNGNGYPPDNSPEGAAELMKFEGRDNCIGESVLLDSVHHGMFCDSAEWSSYMSGNRIVHSVFQNFGGPILTLRDYLDDPKQGGGNYGGSTRVNDLRILNCLFDRLMLNEIYIPGGTDWRDLLMVIVLSSGVSWQNVIQMHGCTIRDASRDASQIYIDISRGVSPPGRRSLQWFLDNHPANFSNITVQTGELFTSPRTFGTSIMPPQIPTYFTPLTTANGVNLTTVAGSDAGSGTTLRVVDSTVFVDPRYGTSPQIHCNGANRSYTAINYATHELTMASGFSRSSGMGVNRAITSGSTPNRGAVL